MKNTLETIYLF